MVDILSIFSFLNNLNVKCMHIIIFLTITVVIASQHALFSKKRNKRENSQKFENEDMERMSYSDETNLPYKPAKEFKAKPDIKNPGSCNRFILVSEITNAPTEIKTIEKLEKSTKLNQNTNSISINHSDDNLKCPLPENKIDDKQIKEEIKVVYRKLSEDFQNLQGLLEMEKHSIYENLSSGHSCLSESKLKDANNASNILIIEDVNSNNGPLTKITLLRKNSIEKKNASELPLILTKNNWTE